MIPLLGKYNPLMIVPAHNNPFLLTCVYIHCEKKVIDRIMPYTPVHSSFCQISFYQETAGQQM